MKRRGLFLVPTLRVGTHVSPLCGAIPSSYHCRCQSARDAERQGVRSHAERGNEKNRCRHLIALLLLGLGVLPATAQPVLPVVENANWEKFQQHGERLFVAMKELKLEVPASAERELKGLAGASDREASLQIIQKNLDSQCLLGININPESRVKAARGAAEPLLLKDREVYFLIKIQNEGGVTSSLAVSGPQLVVKNQPAEGRWLEAAVLHIAQQEKGLGGQRLEYVLLRLRARESGKREATLVFDVGQGTQDLGFRAEVPILFVVR